MSKLVEGKAKALEFSFHSHVSQEESKDKEDLVLHAMQNPTELKIQRLFLSRLPPIMALILNPNIAEDRRFLSSGQD